MQETQEASARAIQRSIGDEASSMISIDMLGVTPALQGKHCGSRLVQHVAAKADAQSRAILLQTTSRNVPFYQRLGFKTVEQFTTGEDDSTWQEAPVVHCVMTREPLLVCGTDAGASPE